MDRLKESELQIIMVTKFHNIHEVNKCVCVIYMNIEKMNIIKQQQSLRPTTVSAVRKLIRRLQSDKSIYIVLIKQREKN